MKENATSHYLEDIIRFKKEIETASRLNHPGIARISGFGEYNGLPYTVMELIEGEGLDSFLEEIHKNNPGFGKITEYFYQLAEILEYVHESGIVHRDIKPGNIFVCRENNMVRFKLLDFGVAHIMELAEIYGEKEITGTFGFMSPEATGQLNGAQ
jgi:Serine/threonine protein kinase